MGIGIIERLFKKQIDTAVKKSIASYPHFNNAFTWIQGFPVYNNSDTIRNINDGYCTSEDVYAIVRRISRTAAMIPLKVYKVVDDKAMEKYMASLDVKSHNTQSLLRKQFLKTKALEEVKPDHPLQRLLDNPNPSYPRTEFYEGCYAFRLITGNTYIHTPMLEFGANAGTPSELWVMPSQWTSLIVSDTWPRRVNGYRLQLATLIQLKAEEVIHVRYFNPQYSYIGNELIGLSPLRAGAKVLTRQEAETDYTVNSFQNSGIRGIVSNESMQGEEGEEAALSKYKTDWYNETAGVENAGKIHFYAGKINYQAIGLGPVDMEIIQSGKMTFKKLCNLYGVSDRLFNNDATGSEISVDIAYKDLYTNAVLPEVYALRDALNNSLIPKFTKGKEKYFIDCDITGITELQDDMKDMANVFSTLPVMNPQVVAKAFNWDYDDVPDTWFMKQGYTSVDDVMAGAVQPLPLDDPDERD